MAAENDRGGEGDAMPVGRGVEGGSYPSDGFKFRPNRPAGCRVMDMGALGLGELRHGGNEYDVDAARVHY